MLVAKYHQSNCLDKHILGYIVKAINSSLQLRSKRELIEGFIKTINADTDVERDWLKFVAQQKESDISSIIASSIFARRKPASFWITRSGMAC